MTIDFTLGIANWLAYEKIGQPFSETTLKQYTILLEDLFENYLSLEDEHHWLIIIYYARILEKLTQKFKQDLEDSDEKVSPLSKEMIAWWAFVMACNFACKFGLDEDVDNRTVLSAQSDEDLPLSPGCYGLDVLEDLLPGVDFELLSDFEIFFFKLLDGDLWVTFNQHELCAAGKKLGTFSHFFNMQQINEEQLHPWEIHSKPTAEVTFAFKSHREHLIDKIEEAASTPVTSAKNTIFLH
ncbi:MAG: hypothetical protein BGO43_08375 [Gammaproteobacteria bacterium 39-13]|nr:hypothetical protein [Gammaproteobacteria bacterium]OJV96466.1 MAG: hypothetical protein BGO43_08375 [Gammaproteobacteria bacterium 39-13]